jgi:hypothetical protein
MAGLRAILVSVDYSDLLQYTLPYNRHHFGEVLVVTDHKGVEDVRGLCAQNDAHWFATEAFYQGGAIFNKWAALEQALDTHGRHGWLCLMDADVLWPRTIPQTPFERGRLYSPLRHMHEDLSVLWTHSPNPYLDSHCPKAHAPCNPADVYHPVNLPFPPEDQWHKFPVHRNVNEWAGYTQIFHAEDPHLGPPPWHQVDWKHAGGADSFFQEKWGKGPSHRKVRLPWQVFHLGPAGTNWMGRASPYVGGTREHPQATVRRFRLREAFLGRRGKAGDERFSHERLQAPKTP